MDKKFKIVIFDAIYIITMNVICNYIYKYFEGYFENKNILLYILMVIYFLIMLPVLWIITNKKTK